jgi:hypothetical protein
MIIFQAFLIRVTASAWVIWLNDVPFTSMILSSTFIPCWKVNNNYNTKLYYMYCLSFNLQFLITLNILNMVFSLDYFLFI